MFNQKKIYTEKELVESCARFEKIGQKALYVQYFPIMYRMLLRYSKDEDALISIANDGFMKVFENISSFNHKGSFEGWIKRIMSNTALDYIRKNKQQKATMLQLFQDREDGTSVLDKMYFEDALELIDMLSDKYKKVFKWFVIDGMNHSEIAELLNVSVGTSRWYLAEAKKQLKEIFNSIKDIEYGS